MGQISFDVPDSVRPYLDEIAERLWAGRAAVMVGAGFSKNAGDRFPSWNELGDLFYQKVYGVKPDPVKQKYLNVLRLAEEVQASIGRPALENLLRSNIPDLELEPSDLHVELLELPWVDVFATNYDTLLERASAKVVTRRYEPVVDKEDLPYAIKPRIVKLHGSFPSERPFIITEEDYRRYPYDYAPFVNTVQQALLENTFCLIGFSGDDPNFLQWIGWIRDNLGKDKMQKIYLVGVFELSSARLQLLAQRGIIVVDLSCCKGIKKNDHIKALKLFFKYLWSKKPNVLDWPYNPKTICPSDRANRVEEIKKITEEWRRQRQTYPGWSILPYSNRETLWRYTISWVDYLPNTESIPPGLDIQYVFELIWRLEKCLLPVFDDVAKFCEKLLEKYWPFQSEKPPVNCQIYPGNNEFHGLPWADLQQTWLAIAVAMLRFYREKGFLDKWEKAKNQLKTLSDYLSADQKEFLNYEGFLYSIFTLDLPNAKLRLESWRPNEAQPYWMVKRAAGLAEIGLFSEAEAVARDALENIRINQRVGMVDLSLVSLESNAMLLAKFIQDAGAIQRYEWGTLKDENMQFKDRWNELKRFKCDPWNELKFFELILENPPVKKKNVTKKRGFDIGSVIQTYHFIDIDEEFLSAYAFLRFCEEIGLPYRIGNYTIARNTVLASLQRIAPHSSFWAFATLVRLGNDKAIDSLFNREAVYRFTAQEADQLINSYLDALDKCRDDIRTADAFRNDSYALRLAHLLPEVISRLCCRCSDITKQRIFVFVAGLYASPDKRNYRNVGNLLKRLIDSMSKVERYRMIPDFLKIPFPEDLRPLLKNEFLNPFLLLKLNQKPACVPTLKIQPELIDHLFQQAALDDQDRRRWSITALVTLYNLQLLDNDQSKNLARTIWRVTDQYGLPDHHDFYKFAFLELPYPENVDLAYLFKNYVKSIPFPVQKSKQNGSVGITRGDIPIVHEIIGANSLNSNFWTAEDAAELLQRMHEWWDADKDRLYEKEYAGFPSIAEEFRARFTCMLELLAEVIGPKLSIDSSDKIKTSLSRLLKETREYGLPSLAAEAACLHIYPEQITDICNRINEALISNQDIIQRDGLEAIAQIILVHKDIDISSVEPNPVSMLCQYLVWSPTRTISKALGIIIRILKDLPNSFSNSLEVATLRRLNRLLMDTTYDNDNSELNMEDKLEIRQISAVLAATLWKYYNSRNLSVPEVIERWREACLSPDEFSEIRNAWRNYEEIAR